MKSKCIISFVYKEIPLRVYDTFDNSIMYSIKYYQSNPYSNLKSNERQVDNDRL